MAELDPKNNKSLSDLITRMESGGLVEKFSETARYYIEERSQVPAYYKSPMRENALAAKEKKYGPFKELSAEKLAAILAYTDGKSKIYEKINTFLRVGEYFGEDVEEIKSFVENLKKALEQLSKANSTEAKRLTRIVSGEYAEELAKLKPGDKIIEKGFGSWAGGEYNAPRADQFIKKDQFNIALDVTTNKAINIAPISAYEREEEHLVYPGQEYEVEDIVPDGAYSRKINSSISIIKLKQFMFGGLVNSSTGARISGTGSDTQLIAAQPGEIVINKKTVEAFGPSYFLSLNKKYGGPNANKPKRSNGALAVKRFNVGGEVIEEPKKELTEAERKAKAQEMIERMKKGFDENLLMNLIDVIRKDDDAEDIVKSTKIKAKKKKYIVVNAESTGQGETFADFLTSKIGSSFKMAAQARRADKGLKKDRMFYLTKALGFQFGGDLVNRTRGTFSQDPNETQDPALSRSQRFAATVAPYMDMQGPELPPDKQDDGGINKAFLGLIKKFDDLISIRKKKSEQAELANDILEETNESSKEQVKESNSLKKRALELSKKLLRFNRDQSDTAKSEKIEQDIESVEDYPGLLRPDLYKDDGIDDEEEDEEEDDRRRDRGLFGRAIDFITGDDFIGDSLIDAGADAVERQAGKVGRRGAQRAIRRTALKIGGKKLAQNALVKGGTQVATKVASKLAPKAILGFLRPIFGRVPIVGGLIDFVVSLALGESPGRAAAKAVGATLGAGLGTLIPIPGVGTVAGGILGDFVGGAIYDAIAGGGNTSEGSQQAPEKLSAGGVLAPRKLASGGVMAGEAGPEAFFSLSSTVGRQTLGQVSSVAGSPLSALPFILGITKNVINSVGPAGKEIKPFMSQIIGPLERMFGAANFTAPSLVGKGIDTVKSTAQKFGGKVGKLFGFGSDEKTDGTEAQETMTGAAATTTPVTGIPLGESETAQGTQLMQGLIQRGFNKEEAAAIVGNLWAESGFKTGATNPTSGAYGLMQWLGGRQDKLVQFAQEKGKPVTDVDLQLDYIAWELRGGNAYETAQFQKAMAYGPTVQDKTRGFAYEVERAGAGELASSMPKRVGAAESAYNAGAAATSPTQVAQRPSSSPSQNNDPDEMSPGPINPISADSFQAPGQQPTSPGRAASPMQQAQVPVSVRTKIGLTSGMTTAIVPVVIQGSNQQVGYATNTPGFEGRTTTRYFDRSGNLTTLDSLKRARLQLN